MTPVESVRIDVWLWRARFAKTRSLAASMVEAGAVRLTHNGVQIRLDKPNRSVHQRGRVTELRVEPSRFSAARRRNPIWLRLLKVFSVYWQE